MDLAGPAVSTSRAWPSGTGAVGSGGAASASSGSASSPGSGTGSHPITALGELRVDGGAAANDLLLQIQADLTGVPVVRPRVRETTALGAAYLAGLTAGVFRDLDEIAARWQPERRFEPAATSGWREEARARWAQAVRAAMAAPAG